jgi:hypothetical protein
MAMEMEFARNSMHFCHWQALQPPWHLLLSAYFKQTLSLIDPTLRLEF